MEAQGKILKALRSRLSKLEPEIQRRVADAEEVTIFGSFAAGLENSMSDLDVFCLGPQKTHLKSPEIEILILPEYEAYSELWLTSELANHIKHFGVPVDIRQPSWYPQAHLTERAEVRKHLRISAHLSSLEKHWQRLSERSKGRFQTKVRREIQRFMLLRSRCPVPPTAVLDSAFALSGNVLDEACFECLTGDDRRQLLTLFPLLHRG